MKDDLNTALGAVSTSERGAADYGVQFLGILGGLHRRGAREAVQTVAALMQEAERHQDPARFAQQIAQAATAWKETFARDPLLASKIRQRVQDGPGAADQPALPMTAPAIPPQQATMQKLAIRASKLPPQQPQRRKAAPPVRGP